MYTAYKVVRIFLNQFIGIIIIYACGVHIVRYLKLIQLHFTLNLLLCIILAHGTGLVDSFMLMLVPIMLMRHPFYCFIEYFQTV